MLRRLVLPVLTVLLTIGAVVPAAAAPRRAARVRHIARVSVQAEGRGSVIAVTYATGPRQHVRFLHSSVAIDRVAVTDVDNDGQQDILAALHDGEVQLWRNQGAGRFSVATVPHDVHPVAERGPRFVRVKHGDDGWQWGDERYDAAMPRAPAVVVTGPVVFIRVSASFVTPRVSIRPASGRAPPSL
jgi:VCBS repeat protein